MEQKKTHCSDAMQPVSQFFHLCSWFFLQLELKSRITCLACLQTLQTWKLFVSIDSLNNGFPCQILKCSFKSLTHVLVNGQSSSAISSSTPAPSKLQVATTWQHMPITQPILQTIVATLEYTLVTYNGTHYYQRSPQYLPIMTNVATAFIAQLSKPFPSAVPTQIDKNVFWDC